MHNEKDQNERRSHILVVSNINKTRKEVRSMKWFSSYRNPDGREMKPQQKTATPKSGGWSHKNGAKAFSSFDRRRGNKVLMHPHMLAEIIVSGEGFVTGRVWTPMCCKKNRISEPNSPECKE